MTLIPCFNYFEAHGCEMLAMIWTFKSSFSQGTKVSDCTYMYMGRYHFLVPFKQVAYRYEYVWTLML